MEAFTRDARSRYKGVSNAAAAIQSHVVDCGSDTPSRARLWVYLGDGDHPYNVFPTRPELTMAQVLDQLGLLVRLKGSGPQRKGPCPLHRGDGRGKTFSVNLDKNVFQCFAVGCGQKGDVIDLWASVNAMSLRQAAIDLVRTFHLEPAPQQRRGHG